jgi:hypothetical protein
MRPGYIALLYRPFRLPRIEAFQYTNSRILLNSWGDPMKKLILSLLLLSSFPAAANRICPDLLALLRLKPFLLPFVYPSTGGPMEKALHEAMVMDRFHQENPFNEVGDLSAVGLALKRGVASFQRTAYRSDLNTKTWANGYDFLVYDIVHPDGQKSIIIVSKIAKDRSELPVAIGTPDPRRFLLQAAVPSPDGGHYFFEAMSGTAVKPDSGDSGVAELSSVESFHALRLSVEENQKTGAIKKVE